MSLITCKDVSFSYEGTSILSQINFQVNSGDYLCIVGENGAGKSTLLKGLLGLKKPMEGEILTGEGLHKADIGYLPQQTIIQKDFPANVQEVILSGCLNHHKFQPFYSKTDKEKAREKMQILNIEDLHKSCYRDLSGGQQQRVLLARALCSTEKLLLLDEPVTGLDPLMTRDLYKILDEINQRLHITIIMVSHDVQGAVQHASHILHLDGKQLFFGTREDYFQSRVGQYFLGGETSC